MGIRASNLTPPVVSYTEAALLDAQARFAGVHGEISEVLETHRGLTPRRAKEWAARLRDAADALDELANRHIR